MAEKKSKTMRVLVGSAVLAVAAVFVYSNYGLTIMDPADIKPHRLVMAKAIGKVAFDFQFAGKHVIITNR